MKNNFEKILIIFKTQRWVQDFIIRKFSHNYNVKHIFISSLIKKNNRQILEYINSIIKNEDISIILFEGDHLSIYDAYFINSIKRAKKGLILYDDYMLHEVNSITASSCDFILNGSPLSSQNFRKAGYESIFMPIESDGNIFKKYEIEKKIDVLFFGDLNPYRKNYINYIKENGINVKHVSRQHPESSSDKDLARLINQSKIVINFSRAEFLKKIHARSVIIENYYQLKGRIYQTGLCGTACISEYSPEHEIIFDDNELISFNSKEECVNVIKKILNDPEVLKSYSENLYKKCLKFEDKNYITKIKKFIDSIQLKKIGLDSSLKTPFWYKWIFVKQRLWLRFRNVSFKSFFTEVFDIIFLSRHNSFIESLVFFLYSLVYSLTFLLRWLFVKTKKIV